MKIPYTKHLALPEVHISNLESFPTRSPSCKGMQMAGTTGFPRQPTLEIRCPTRYNMQTCELPQICRAPPHLSSDHIVHSHPFCILNESNTYHILTLALSMIKTTLWNTLDTRNSKMYPHMKESGRPPSMT